MSHEQVAALFDAWWQESFPMAPPNRQSRENFIAWGLALLAQQQTSQENSIA